LVDDRGSNANVRIVGKLRPGECSLSVCHEYGNAAGAYSVGVTTGLMIFSNRELDGLVRTLKLAEGDAHCERSESDVAHDHIRLRRHQIGAIALPEST
jgi:hypothetical protein